MKNLFGLIVIFISMGTKTSSQSFSTIGKIVIVQEEARTLIDENAPIEILADGFEWAEGPVWWKERNALLFSDVPQNTVYIWKSGTFGAEPFIKPSGYTGVGIYSDEPGSNGLTMDNNGNLISCEHGDRRVSIMPLNSAGGKRTITDNFQGKRFNSPNDVIIASNGRIYFTDPPYGLANKDKDASRESSVFGVYMYEKGKTTLVIKDLNRPNGLAMSPDEKIVYVAQSDPDKAIYMRYPVLSTGLLGKGVLHYDATPMSKQGMGGLPDGIKVDHKGNIWGTGPGGVLIISPKGNLLARIETTQNTANCGWGDDGSTLYITADRYLLRVKTKVKGVPFR